MINDPNNKSSTIDIESKEGFSSNEDINYNKGFYYNFPDNY